MPERKPLFTRLTPVLPVALTLAMNAHAQPLFTPDAGLASWPGFVGPGPNWGRGCGPGVGWSYYGVRESPTTAFTDMRRGVWNWGWAGNPSHAPDMWEKHLSRYGSAVPNYVPTAAMAACDARKHFIHPPTFGYGLNVFGYRSAVVRLAAPSVSVRPATAPLLAPTSACCARLEVRLPSPDAEVWVNKAKMTATGTVRSFESPELAEGKPFGYELVARWSANGEPKEEARSLVVTAGSTTLVDFGK
jgi:uncharacterized protein (TIGR03000 family)